MAITIETNYFGKPYHYFAGNNKVKSFVRKGIKTGKFNLIICSEIYKEALFNFIVKTTNLDIHNVKNLFKVHCVYSNKNKNDQNFLDKSLFYLQSNSIFNRQTLIKEFSNILVQNHDNYVFPKYISLPKEDDEVNENLLFGSFDENTNDNNINNNEVKSFIPNILTEKLTEEDMEHIFPILPNYVNEEYFFNGIKEFLSLHSEVLEVINYSLN